MIPRASALQGMLTVFPRLVRASERDGRPMRGSRDSQCLSPARARGMGDPRTMAQVTTTDVGKFATAVSGL